MCHDDMDQLKSDFDGKRWFCIFFFFLAEAPVLLAAVRVECNPHAENLMLLLVMAGGPGCVELYKMFFYENMDDGDKTVFALGFIQIIDDFKKLHDSEPNPEVWNFTLTCYRLMQCSQRTATEWIDDSQSVKLCRCEVDSSCNHELHKHFMIFFFLA